MGKIFIHFESRWYVEGKGYDLSRNINLSIIVLEISASWESPPEWSIYGVTHTVGVAEREFAPLLHFTFAE